MNFFIFVSKSSGQSSYLRSISALNTVLESFYLLSKMFNSLIKSAGSSNIRINIASFSIVIILRRTHLQSFRIFHDKFLTIIIFLH